MTLIEPDYGPWGPNPYQKEDSIWGNFLNFSLNLKFDTFWSPRPNFRPLGHNPISSRSISIRVQSQVQNVHKIEIFYWLTTCKMQAFLLERRYNYRRHGVPSVMPKSFYHT